MDAAEATRIYGRASRRRSRLDQRVTAFVTSVAVVVAFTWFVWCANAAYIAVTGGVAGAVLAPTVVRGR